MSACCSPSSGRPAQDRGTAGTTTGAPEAAGSHPIEQVEVPGGAFAMGDHHHEGYRSDGEDPVHVVVVGPFTIDATTVTNEAFAAFVDATGHLTDAERFGWSAVFHLAVEAPDDSIAGTMAGAPWWYGVNGADWRHPNGPDSGLDGLADHPVVHVSWNDAQAYCRWAGRRLPTEAQWERAARGGLEGARYPWGDDLLDDDGRWRCNIWQGDFPGTNTLDDGWLTTAPVRSYEPNGFGLWQPIGNVWEWCHDRFDPSYYQRSPGLDPTGPDPAGPDDGGTHVIRGGSYLCHESYCNRYRCAARSSNTADSSTGNMGFRTVGA